MIICGDCLAEMAKMDANSVDAIVTDPPYGLTSVSRNGSPRQNDPATPHGRTRLGGGFMGKTWDAKLPGPEIWAEALRVAKPGCHLLAFGGTRTFHRLVCAIEDAGWEIRDGLGWLYGSGFPKSESVSLAIDKKACREELEAKLGRKPTKDEFKAAWVGYRNVVGDFPNDRPNSHGKNAIPVGSAGLGQGQKMTSPATDAARQWEGWGTALKPAWEPIILARKPLDGTVAANVLKWGTGAINVDGCRVEVDPAHDDMLREVVRKPRESQTWEQGSGFKNEANHRTGVPSKGRWPANLLHDGSDEVLELFPQTGPGMFPPKRGDGQVFGKSYGADQPTHKTDSGSAARFFYCAKASRKEREMGLDCIEIVMVEYHTWENEDRKARLRVDMGQFPPRVIAVSGTPDNDASEWSMFLFGNSTTAPSLPGIPSTTLTRTNSITESRTLRFVAPLLTSESTAGANGKTAHGISPAENVDESTPLLIITREKTASRLGAGNVASATLWKIKGNAASPADHPTVKPLALMRYLCRLVTPPGGLILDPFMGSGTTLLAAGQEGFRAVGIEVSEEYCEIARKRIYGELIQPAERA